MDLENEKENENVVYLDTEADTFYMDNIPYKPKNLFTILNKDAMARINFGGPKKNNMNDDILRRLDDVRRKNAENKAKLSTFADVIKFWDRQDFKDGVSRPGLRRALKDVELDD